MPDVKPSLDLKHALQYVPMLTDDPYRLRAVNSFHDGQAVVHALKTNAPVKTMVHDGTHLARDVKPRVTDARHLMQAHALILM